MDREINSGVDYGGDYSTGGRGPGDDADDTSKTSGVTNTIKILLIVMYALITTVAIGGNSIVCYLVFAYKRMRTVPNYFIVNLAISDILMAVFCIPFTFIANLLLHYWPFGPLMCPAVSYLQVVTVFLSAFTLMAMGLDRYIVVVHPFMKRITPRQTTVVIVAIWVLSLTVPLPTLVTSSTVPENDTSSMYGLCLEVWEHEANKYAYSLVIMVLHYFGPLAVLTFSYLRIGYFVWIKRPNRHGTSPERLQLPSSKQKDISVYLMNLVQKHQRQNPHPYRWCLKKSQTSDQKGMCTRLSDTNVHPPS